MLSNISFVFWAMEFQEKLLLRFTDLYEKKFVKISDKYQISDSDPKKSPEHSSVSSR